MTDQDLFAPSPSAALPDPSVQPSYAPASPGGLDPRVVWTVGGEAAGDLAGRQAVASVIRNRINAGAPDALSVATEPNQFAAYGTNLAENQKRFPVGSPQYNELEGQIAPIITGAQPPTVPYTAFRTHGVDPKWAGNSAVTTIGGNDFATVPYAYSAGSPQTSDAAAPTRAQLDKEFDGLTGPVTVGPEHLPSSPAQNATIAARQAAGLIDTKQEQGTDANPYAEKLRKDGTAEPLPAGAYVDLGGQFHPAPRSTVQLVGNALAGLGQGGPVDALASGVRFGFRPDPTDVGLSPSDPTLGSYSGPASQQSALAGARQEQADYALRHAGEPEAQTGRFVGQGALATLAAGAVPEVSALRGVPLLGRGAQIVTNALLGTAAAASNVGANPDVPVSQQLGMGAVGGAAVPEAIGAAGRGFQAVTGLGRTVAPKVAELADAAQNKYGIPLQSGQVAGPKFGASDTQRQQWMRAVTGTYGDQSGDVSPEALQASRVRIGGQMDQIAARNSITDPDALQTRLGQIVHDAQGVIGEDQVKPLLTMVKRIGDVRDGNAISGDAYAALTAHNAPLERLQKSADPNVSHYAGQIRDALDDALEASAQPGDVQAFQNARFQYKNLMTVAKAAPKQDPETGIIPGSALQSAVGSNFKNQAFQGAADLGELAQIHKAFLSAPPRQTPTKNSIASGVGLGLGFGGGSELAESVANGLGPHALQNAVAAAPYAAALGAGAWATRAALRAIENNKNYGSATNIVDRSLPSAPGAPSALSGLKAVRPLEIPLSALMGVKLAPTLNASPVSANAAQ